eukprot:gene6448-8209_t
MKSWQIVRLLAGFFVLLSLALGVEGSPVFVNEWWLAFTAFVGLNLLQSALTKCKDMRSPLFKPRPLSGWVLAALLAAPSAQALDLLQTWEQARQHDPQMQVVAATRSSVQAFEDQAKALWRP